MVLHLTLRHLTLDDASRGLIEEKLAKIEKHLHHTAPVSVVLWCERHLHFAEIGLHDKGVDYHSKAEHADVLTAVELAVEKLDKQICRHKEKDVTSRHLTEG